jgi:hypothetical protein
LLDDTFRAFNTLEVTPAADRLKDQEGGNGLTEPIQRVVSTL